MLHSDIENKSYIVVIHEIATIFYGIERRPAVIGERHSDSGIERNPQEIGKFGRQCCTGTEKPPVCH